MQITLTLNGIKVTEDVAADMLLIDFVRAHGCKSVKRGCETSNCGLCTVFLDDVPVLSCSVLAARADGHRVTTLEGLQEEAAEFGAFIADQGAEQCGFCNPGFIMNALALFRENPDPGEDEIKEYLAGSRPTAVNLVAALNRMERVLVAHPTLSVPEWKELLYKEAIAIREEDAAACRQIGENCLELLRPGMGILTHCNAGHLAVSEYGTALAPIYLGQERGYGFKVFADETRPLLQGARLTAYELSRAGVDVTLICDNMASVVMRKGWVHAVVVGCDRVAANGDVANKIGTSGVAILARHYKIPFYVLGPTSTIDGSCPDGDSIVIEERNPDEVTEMWYSRRMAPKDVKVYNPAFDITPHELITAIITEKGIFYKNNR